MSKIEKVVRHVCAKLSGKEYYKELPFSYLLTNFFYQRIIGFNRTLPFSVHFTSKVLGFNNMKLGINVAKSFAVSGGCYIVVSNGTILDIGDETIFAANVCMRTANHDFFDRKKYIKGNITIGKNCWIGFGAALLPGVTLGDNVTVGANSVVTKSFPSNVVIAGVPAKIIKELAHEFD